MIRVAAIVLLLPLSLCCAEDHDKNVYVTMSACAESSVVRREEVVCSQRLPLIGRTGLACLFRDGAASIFGDLGLAYHLAPGLFVDQSAKDNEQEWESAKQKAYAAAQVYLGRCSKFEFTGAKPAQRGKVQK